MQLSGLRSVLSVKSLMHVVPELRFEKSNLLTRWLLDGRPTYRTKNDEVLSFNFVGKQNAGKRNFRGKPAHKSGGLSITRRQSGLVRAHDSVELNASWIPALSANPNSTDEDPNALTVVTRIMSDTVEQQARTLDMMVAQAIFTGHIFSDSSDDILIASVNATTGAVTDPGSATNDYDFVVPDNRRGNLDGLIDTVWSDAEADILAQLVAIRKWAAENKLAIPDQIRLPEEYIPVLLNNTKFKDWANFSSSSIDAALKGEFIQAYGWQWTFVKPQFIETSSTDTTPLDIWPTGRALITSSAESTIEVTEGVEHFMPGSDTYLVGGSPADLTAGLQEMYGDFGYAKIEKGDSPSLQIAMGFNRGWDISRACILTPKLFS